MTKDQVDTWLAGLIDGEGSIMVRVDSKDETWVIVQISNTSLELLKAVQERVGFGSVMDAGSGSIGKPGYKWKASKAKAKEVLQRTFPYLIVKRQIAELALRILSTIKNGRGDWTSEEYFRDRLLREKLLEIWKTLKTQNRKAVSDVPITTEKE